MMAGAYLYADWSDIDAEFDRLEKMPTPAMVARLDAALEELFAFSQMVVHVDTASLKSSGRKSSTVDQSRNTWEGEIEYGGPSTGVNNPVDYAWYEQRRDDAHDFMKPVTMLADDTFSTAMLKGLL